MFNGSKLLFKFLLPYLFLQHIHHRSLIIILKLFPISVLGFCIIVLGFHNIVLGSVFNFLPLLTGL